jgi:N-formylglutamate deformylase
MKIGDIVLSIPHASSFIPPEIRARMPHRDDVLLREPDLFTDRIYTMQGPRIVQARTSRVISDVNRAPDEIYTSGRQRATGVVMLSFSSGEDVFEEDPPIRELQQWIRAYHDPFHDELARVLCGAKFLIDCHSMWSRAPAHRMDAGTPRPDVVLCNRLFTTCDAATTNFFRDAFQKRKFTVAVNDPFIGRYVVGTHCSRKWLPGVQIELNRSLYMDEQSLEPRDPDIEHLRKVFVEIVEEFCAWDEGRGSEEALCDLSV